MLLLPGIRSLHARSSEGGQLSKSSRSLADVPIQSTASEEELQSLFLRYATSSPDDEAPRAIQLPTDMFLNSRPDKASTADKPNSEDLATATLSLEGFTAFLLSTDNSAFSDQDASIHHDMTRPLSEYYISSSHNTYLVGHQLVGDSTIEGYIRALLHSCRSVERECPLICIQELV